MLDWMTVTNVVTSNCKCITEITRNDDGASEEGESFQKRLQMWRLNKKLQDVELSVIREFLS